MSTLEVPVFNPAGKTPYSTNFLPVTGIISLVMKRTITIKQGTIHAFSIINLSHSQ
jgi:hypothetical protein